MKHCCDVHQLPPRLGPQPPRLRIWWRAQHQAAYHACRILFMRNHWGMNPVFTSINHRWSMIHPLLLVTTCWICYKPHYSPLLTIDHWFTPPKNHGDFSLRDLFVDRQISLRMRRHLFDGWTWLNLIHSNHKCHKVVPQWWNVGL